MVLGFKTAALIALIPVWLSALQPSCSGAPTQADQSFSQSLPEPDAIHLAPRSSTSPDAVTHLPPRPSPFSHRMDQIWRSLALGLLDSLASRRETLERELEQIAKSLPGQPELPQAPAAEMRAEANYEHLPEVHLDPAPRMDFPKPMVSAQSSSWFDLCARARKGFQVIDDFESKFSNWKQLNTEGRVSRFEALVSDFEGVNSAISTLMRKARYTDFAHANLNQQWESAQRRNEIPREHRLIEAILAGNASAVDSAREGLRPHRVMKRAFLPDRIEKARDQTITLPMATDIQKVAFLREVEGALDTYWNQSPWAKENHVRFAIQWLKLPRDLEFHSKKNTLDQHLAKFPKNHLALTTGGISNFVRGSTLVLGVGNVTPRTLAHEIGHLLGFDDCYFRTLHSQGLFGLTVLEWDNPLYPDELMCDNSSGVPKALVW